VKNRTKGRVEITYYPGSASVAGEDVEGVVTGIADMGVSHVSYYARTHADDGDFRAASSGSSGWVATG